MAGNQRKLCLSRSLACWVQEGLLTMTGLSHDARARSDTVGVLRKALAVLTALQRAPGDLGLTELAKQAGINKTTCYRIVSTLLKEGIIEPGTQSGTYRLGIRLLELGATVQSRLSLRQIARPFLVELAEKTEEAVFLCILRGDRALCIDHIEGKHVGVVALRTGESLPLHIGGAPRALLAGLPDDRVWEILNSPLVPWTSKTPTDPNALWAIVQEVRAQGYSVSEEDVTLGIAAIGAPIFDHTGMVIGAISISGTVQRFAEPRRSQLIRWVMAAAQGISRRMGYRGPFVQGVDQGITGDKCEV
jgi:DNA-binding IclR family transcriptional regulator